MSNQAPIDIVFEEGAKCQQADCDGTIEVLGGLNCSCHISPPCNSCIETGMRCNKCDWYPEYED